MAKTILDNLKKKIEIFKTSTKREPSKILFNLKTLEALKDEEDQFQFTLDDTILDGSGPLSSTDKRAIHDEIGRHNEIIDMLEKAEEILQAWDTHIDRIEERVKRTAN